MDIHPTKKRLKTILNEIEWCELILKTIHIWDIVIDNTTDYWGYPMTFIKHCSHPYDGIGEFFGLPKFRHLRNKFFIYDSYKNRYMPRFWNIPNEYFHNQFLADIRNHITILQKELNERGYDFNIIVNSESLPILL